MPKWSDTVALDASRVTLNGDLRGARNSTMLALIGNPRGSYSQDCQFPTNPAVAQLVVHEDVGPFKVRGLKPAVDSLREVLSEVAREEPGIAGSLGNMGMLCCRFVRGSTSSISNHSWGTAIDLTIDGKLDVRGDSRAQRGLLRIHPIFNRHSWFWGAAFGTEDSMHFEVSDQLIRTWAGDGLFGGGNVKAVDDSLSVGDRGDDVADLQRRLGPLTGLDIVTDGLFGPATKAAIMEFQRRNGLKVDGIATSATIKAIRAAMP